MCIHGGSNVYIGGLNRLWIENTIFRQKLQDKKVNQIFLENIENSTGKIHIPLLYKISIGNRMRPSKKVKDQFHTLISKFHKIGLGNFKGICEINL
jgi:hypothetical protein